MVTRTFLLLCAVVALTACTPAAVADAPTSGNAAGGEASTDTPADVLRGLSIPSIGVDVDGMIPLGVDAQLRPEVPSEDDPMVVGWYVLGPTPGDKGPAVLMAHVNAHHTPGAFARLHELAKGDRVTVGRGGRLLTFEVYATAQADKDTFPEGLVFGDTAGPELRLITCGGELNVAERSYEDNISVSARLVV